MKNLLKDTKIRTRIFLLLGLTMTLMSLVTMIGLWQVNKIGKEITTLTKLNIPLKKVLSRITFNSMRQRINFEHAVGHGKAMAQDAIAKDNFEIEREKFLKSGQTTIQEIAKGRKLIEQLLENYRASQNQDKVVKIDYELRNISKRHSDYQFSAKRVLNLLAQNRGEQAQTTIEKIGKTYKQDEQKNPLESLLLAIEGFIQNSTAHAQKNKQTAVMGMLLFSASILIFGLGAGVFISRGISKPLQLAVNIANQIAAGDRDITIKRTAKDETGQLLKTIEEMSFSIKQSEEALRDSEQRYRSIFEQAADSIVLVDIQAGDLVEFNNKTCENLGYTREEFQKLRISDFEVIESAEEVGKHIEKIIKEGSDVFETKHRTKDGKIRDILVSSRFITINERKFCQSIWSDITERKRAEETLQSLNEELEATVDKLTVANRELRDFAYIVSHDLKAPLRGIATLANWISTDYADKLDEQGREEINLLIGRAGRMHDLIDGILQYSRVGRIKEEKVVVNLNELVSEVIDLIAPPENIAITVENELPTIECEQTRIIQVFQNLLSNAIKYIDKPQGQVKIGCIEEDGWWKFSISDNGPGIEEKYFEKIFQIFQTLSRRDEFESTGVGLSLVRKIAEVYGGKVWVESQPGQGSTFFFTLPKQERRVRDEELQKVNIID